MFSLEARAFIDAFAFSALQARCFNFTRLGGGIINSRESRLSQSAPLNRAFMSRSARSSVSVAVSGVQPCLTRSSITCWQQIMISVISFYYWLTENSVNVSTRSPLISNWSNNILTWNSWCLTVVCTEDWPDPPHIYHQYLHKQFSNKQQHLLNKLLHRGYHESSWKYPKVQEWNSILKSFNWNLVNLHAIGWKTLNYQLNNQKHNTSGKNGQHWSQNKQTNISDGGATFQTFWPKLSQLKSFKSKCWNIKTQFLKFPLHPAAAHSYETSSRQTGVFAILESKVAIAFKE